MNVRRMLAFCSLVLSLMLLSAPEAPAVSAIVNAVPGGDGVFLLNGNAINYLESMELTVTYDPATMEIVSVQQGAFVSGGTLSSSSAGPGQLRISVRLTEPLSGNGRIANIAYTPKAGSAGRIISLSGTLINSQGNTMPTNFQVPVLSDQQQTADKAAADKAAADKAAADKAAADKAAADKAAADQAAADQAAAGTSPVTQTAVAPPTATGLPASVSVSMGKDEAKPEKGESPESPASPAEPVPTVAPGEKMAAAEAAAKIEPAGSEAANGVLERFRNYKGERSLQAFAALFKDAPNSAITQEPRIVLADGTAKATLLIKGQSALKYSLQKAKRGTLKKAGENNWQLEVVPEKGTYTALLLIKQGSSATAFPLTVAPPAKVTEKDLSAYFQERAKGSSRYDLNKDGVVNYIDDYIFTANYLAARQKTGQAGKK